jgi:hypothetical protein
MVLRGCAAKFWMLTLLQAPECASTLSQLWGLCGQMILRAKPAVAELLVGSPKPDRSKVMTQTKGTPWFSRLGVWRGGDDPTPEKNLRFENPRNAPDGINK